MLLFSFSLLLLLLVSSTRRHYGYKYTHASIIDFSIGASVREFVRVYVCVLVTIPLGFAYFSGGFLKCRMYYAFKYAVDIL